jgi:hypothetical protein
MHECEHTKTKLGTATRILLDHRFSTKAQVCADCDAVLWTGETQARFNQWLGKLFAGNPERFVLQPRFSKRAVKALDALVAEFAGASRGLMMRAMAYVMVEELPNDQRFAADLAGIQELSVYKDLMAGETTHVRVRVNPRQFLDFQTWGQVTDFSPSKVMETAVVSFLALLAEYRRRHADDQTRQITERVSRLVKAA